MMHDNEILITDDLVRSLVADQFPHWADLHLTRFQSAGTDHAIYRLGSELALRLPRIHWALGQGESDHRHLPGLRDLPLSVPEPVALGRATTEYPCIWAIHRWLEGQPASPQSIPDQDRMARDLGHFVRALRAHDCGDVPLASGKQRGMDLALRDAETRVALRGISDLFDESALVRVWEDSLNAPRYDGPPKLIHGDLHWGNLLAREARLSAVLDWGCLGAGDPAPDLLPAWWVFDAGTRPVFLSAAEAEGAMIRRGRGWALTVAAVGLAYYRGGRNPVLAGMDTVAIRQILAETTS
jgi:aminoglycoside phosphotransferase (APT) family kinase protein